MSNENTAQQKELDVAEQKSAELVEQVKSELVLEPKTIRDLVKNHSLVLTNYGKILQFIYDDNERLSVEASVSDEDFDIKKFKDNQEKICESQEFVESLRKEAAEEAKSIEEHLDKGFRIDLDNVSMTNEYGCAEVKFYVDGQEEPLHDFRATFTKAYWPTDKDEKAPSFIAFEAQRMARETEDFLWGRGDILF